MSIKDIVGRLPDDFLFGVATSSYQIEGSSFGGCGPSHWDDFAAEPGRVANGENGAIACDHYHRYEEDLDLVRDGGFGAYRFSFSWARLLPENDRASNAEGIAFYDRLIDGILERGITPFAALYHWDLPRRHAQRGGWTERDIAKYFADYTDLVMRHFGDRLHAVAPINEPWCVAWLSHYWGEHAPGLRDIGAAARAMHHVQLAHGLSVEAMRANGHGNVGCILNKEYGVPGIDTDAAHEKTELFDGIYNRWFEESMFRGRYPEDVLAVLGPHMPKEFDDDMACIAAPLDWVGANYYTRALIMPDASEPHIGFRCERGDLERTDMGWEIDPAGLGFFLRRLATDYAPGLPLYVTENGMANDDVPGGGGSGANGSINDQARITYFERHLEVVEAVVAEGVPLKGYFAWSLLDNYEWALGYGKRFGLVYVDYETLERVPKESYGAWREICEIGK